MTARPQKLQNIRCHWCRKLIWSARWPKARREDYDKNRHHCVEGAAAQGHLLLVAIAHHLTVVNGELKKIEGITEQLTVDAKLLALQNKPKTRKR